MRKTVFSLVFFVFAIMSAAAQDTQIIDYDFEIQRPLKSLITSVDCEDGVNLPKGYKWNFKVEDFDTAGNIVTFTIYDQDGEEVLSRYWHNVTALENYNGNGDECYYVTHGDYIYLMVFRSRSGVDAGTWCAFLCTKRINE